MSLDPGYFLHRRPVTIKVGMLLECRPGRSGHHGDMAELRKITDPRTMTGAIPFTSSEAYQAAVLTLSAAAGAYYTGTESSIDDSTYDALLAQVRATEAIEPDWVIAHQLLAVGAGQGGDVAHSSAMLSLDNVFNRSELDAWHERLVRILEADGYQGQISLIVEPKLDGIALAARYEDGRLTVAITRGDGSAGEDVTAQLQTVIGLPMVTTGPLAGRSFEVRGEVFLRHDDFSAANVVRTAAGHAPFANPRNATAGTVRARKREYQVQLSFAAYDLLAIDGSSLDLSYAGAMDELAASSFATARGVCQLTGTVESVDLAWETISALDTSRATLGFDIDGAVIKVDAIHLRVAAGSTSRAPRWAIAFKYPADTRLTELLDIVVDVGRTGRCTPVAVLAPVSVGGVTIERATLHNSFEVTRRDVRPGDQVWVRRAGEVIPEVVGPQLETRAAGSQPWAMPTTCPRCAAELDRTGQVWRCVNRSCGLAEQIEYWASRKALDIEGLGTQLVAQLVERGIVSDVADLYTLTVEALVELDRMAETSATKVLAEIEGSKTQPLSRFLTGLGIRLTGERVCRRIAGALPTLEAVRAASVAELAAIEGIGTVRADQIVSELAELSDVIDRLVSAGCRSDEPVVVKPMTGALAGKKVCVTGTIPGMTRDEAQAAVEALGGTAVSSVSKATDILVAGAKAGSKLAKAESLGITVLEADAFVALAANS